MAVLGRRRQGRPEVVEMEVGVVKVTLNLSG
jgi:hypothetical protein